MSESHELWVLGYCRDMLVETLQHAIPVAHEDSVLAIQAAIARIEADLKAVRAEVGR